MKRFSQKYTVVAFLGFALLASVASAQSLPDGDGKAVMQKICNACHEAEVVIGMKQTKDGWSATIDEMVSRGAEGTDAEFDKIVEYLAKNFGKEGGKINVNKAAAKDLESGLAIPAKDAEAIVKYRQEKGAFKTLDDLKKVPGVDAAKIDAKKDQVEF
jgi:competence protein ComEA